MRGWVPLWGVWFAVSACEAGGHGEVRPDTHGFMSDLEVRDTTHDSAVLDTGLGDDVEADAGPDPDDGVGQDGDGEDGEVGRLDGDSPDGLDAHDGDSPDSHGHPCPEWEGPPETRLWGDKERAPLALRLPIANGVKALVTQGNDGAFSHFGDQRFAWDFAVPYGTTVHAAATGTVVWVEDSRVGAGAGPEWRDLANFIVLDHGGGLFTSYVHLAVGSAEVLPGDVVSFGDVLAETGESGQLTGPHLHFQVENVWSESVPAAFARESACDWVPAIGDEVVGAAVTLSDRPAVSTLPGESFEEDGVLDVVGLPARLMSRSETYRVSGRAPARSATEVYFLALPPEGGSAIFAHRFEVGANRRFAGDISIFELPVGQYGWALVAGSGQAVSVPRSVRAAVVD